jgi:hypothetical protein
LSWQLRNPVLNTQHPRFSAWLFYPCKDESCLKASSCSCKHTNEGSSSMRCEGPEFDQGMQTKHIKGKPWAVFVHGGEFTWGSNIDQGYGAQTVAPQLHAAAMILTEIFVYDA